MSGRLLRAGPMSVVFDGGELRWLRLGPDELIRGIYVAVRDAAWGTVPGRLQDLRVEDDGETFEVTFRSVHRQRGLAFTWDGRITGQSDGAISFIMDGTAESTLLRNRIGFCVLHPPSVAGAPITVETPDGAINGEFPEHISPHQPFREILGIRWPTPAGGEADIRFEGDLFEMEDQRNWTDASFKSYCTPLRIPYPVRVERGTKVHQSVHLRLMPHASSVVSRTDGPGHRIESVPASADSARIDVREPVGPLPMLGIALSPGHERLTSSEARRLRDLHLGLLFVTVNLRQPDWRSVISNAAGSAAATNTRLRIEVIGGDDGEGLGDFMGVLDMTAVPLDSIIGFPATGYTTTRVIAERLRSHAASLGIPTVIIGGSRAHFTELNRADLPVDEVDAIAYPITPQVHAFDDASIIETIAVQGLTVRDSLRIGAGRPVHVGPITLRPRFNAYSDPGLDWGPGNEMSRVDPRQQTWFAAPWMLASIAALARHGASSLIYFEATGPAGIIDGSGSEPMTPGPAEQVFGALGELAGATVCGTDGPWDVATLALETSVGRSFLIAHHHDTPRRVTLGSDRRLGPIMARTLGPSSTPIDVDQSAATIGFEVGPASLVRVDVGRVPGDPAD